MKFKNFKCIGGKISKHRVTVLVCANATVTEKRILLMNGKSQKPCCLKNAMKLPMKYTVNNDTWVVAEFFNKEIEI